MYKTSIGKGKRAVNYMKRSKFRIKSTVDKTLQKRITLNVGDTKEEGDGPLSVNSK